MRISRINSITTSKVTGLHDNDVTNRMDEIRSNIRKYGHSLVDLNNAIDQQAIKRFSTIHGSNHVKIERSSHAKLIILNFKK